MEASQCEGLHLLFSRVNFTPVGFSSNERGQASIIYARELWIYQASEGQYMFYTTLPSIYFGLGYDLIAGGSIDDGLADLFARVRQSNQLRRPGGTDMPDVLSPVVYD